MRKLFLRTCFAMHVILLVSLAPLKSFYSQGHNYILEQKKRGIQAEPGCILCKCTHGHGACNTCSLRFFFRTENLCRRPHQENILSTTLSGKNLIYDGKLIVTEKCPSCFPSPEKSLSTTSFEKYFVDEFAQETTSLQRKINLRQRTENENRRAQRDP